MGIFWSSNGSELYIVGDGEVWMYALSVPFSYDGRYMSYIGREKLIK